jgi:hypothetical protein
LVNEEFYDDPISATFSLNETGEVALQKIIWQNQTYRIVAVGRQWDESKGRHVLAEATDGTRFELELRREDFTWRVKRVWRTQAVA